MELAEPSRRWPAAVAVSCAAAALMVAAPAAHADQIADYPEVFDAPTEDRPVTLTPAAQSVIEDGTALVADPAAADGAAEAAAVSGLKATLTRGRLFRP